MNPDFHTRLEHILGHQWSTKMASDDINQGKHQLRNTLRNGTLVAKLGVFTLWDFAAVSQLRNEGYCAAKWHSCAKIGLAAAKYPAEWSFGYEIRLFLFAMRFAATKQMLLCCEVALVCQNWFRSCEFAERAIGLCADFATKSRQRNLFFRCSLVG